MKDKSLLVPFTALLLAILAVDALPAGNFDKTLYERRRQKLMETMGTGIAVFRNSGFAARTNDVSYYPFRTNSDFFYLTGFEDPEAAFLLIPEGEKKFIMFVQPKNAYSAQWFGDVSGVEGAMAFYGADTAYALKEFDDMLSKFLQNTKRVFFDTKNEELRDKLNASFSNLQNRGPKEIIDIVPDIHAMRLIKDDSEIALLRRAVEITCEGHSEVMKALEPGMHEYEIGSIFSYVFERNGSASKAYESMVASGRNATVYHYSRMDGQIRTGDLVLMDMGAEWGNYAVDITRVIPANGKFTQSQKEVYTLVLKMQKAAIEHMKPGAQLSDGMKETERIAKDGLFALGLITDKESPWQHLLYYYPYFIHPIGLDVHDVGGFDLFGEKGRKLEAGMAFAVEPLIYIGENLVENFRASATRRFSVPKEEVDAFLETVRPAFEKYKSVAARVEDDVLITDTGNEILSARLPKTVEEIERTMKERSSLNSKRSR